MYSRWAFEQFGKRLVGKWDTKYQPTPIKQKGGINVTTSFD